MEYSCAHCPGVDPKHCVGVYTGAIDIDFLPHTPGDEGVLNIPAGQIVSEWRHGCPVDYSVVVLRRKQGAGNPIDFFDKIFREYKSGFAANGG